MIRRRHHFDANVTPAVLAIEHIRTHLKVHDELTATRRRYLSNVPSLGNLATETILESLRYDTADTIRVLSSSCSSRLLSKVLNNPKLHYETFRAVREIPPTDFSGPGVEQVRKLQLVDPAVWLQKNERYIRHSGHKKMGMLVTLEDGDAIWPGSTLSSEFRTLTRKDPPREGVSLLDQKRPRRLKIQPSTTAFVETFERLTGNIFKGLNWDNVFVAGGMALSTLICINADLDSLFRDSDIDIYIYGLGPEEANKKVREIHETWSRNLGPSKSVLLVKNSKTINFIPNYPDRRIQIVLKVVASPAEVLLNFDLDPCAIGFDGKSVLMLPRCAHAIETGYTCFTMDLIHGHHLGDRRATQQVRLFKYAARGFGIYIPSQLIDCLKIDFLSRARGEKVTEDEEIIFGKKAMRRIAFAAEDTVRRFYLGPTVLTTVHETDERRYLDAEGTEFFKREPPDEYDFEDSEGNGKRKEDVFIRASYAELNGSIQHLRQPGGRSGLCINECFMHCVALWDLECEGLVKICKDSFESSMYDDQSYDDLPKYEWDDSFNPGTFTSSIDLYNNRVFADVQNFICHSTNHWIGNPINRWGGYLTRRIRRMVYADNLDDLFSKQITLPIYLPWALEEYIHSTMRIFCSDQDIEWSDEMAILIPVHNPSQRGGSNIPSIAVGDWRLRMWVIGNNTMWAKHDRRIDEIFEVLWTFYHIQWSQDKPGFHNPVTSANETNYTAVLDSYFDRRPPFIPTVREEDEDEEWPDNREEILFRDWFALIPLMINRGNTGGGTSHSLYDEGDFEFRDIKEEWYWDEERDGRNDNGVWRDVDTPTSEENPWLKRKREDSGLQGMSAEIQAKKVETGEGSVVPV